MQQAGVNPLAGKTLREIKAHVRNGSRVIGLTVKPPYVLVEIRGGAFGHVSTGVGFAKCNPVDQWDEEQGVKIATGRAEAAIARALHRMFKGQDALKEL